MKTIFVPSAPRAVLCEVNLPDRPAGVRSPVGEITPVDPASQASRSSASSLLRGLLALLCGAALTGAALHGLRLLRHPARAAVTAPTLSAGASPAGSPVIVFECLEDALKHAELQRSPGGPEFFLANGLIGRPTTSIPTGP